MQTAAATLAGNALGANDNKKLNSLAKAIVPLEVGLMVISGSLLFIFAPILIRLFSSDAQVIRLGSTVLRMVAVSEPFYGVPIVIEGMMQGVGKTVTPFIFNVAGMWGVRILGTFYLHPSSWTGTCVCLGMHDRSQYASFCFIHFTLFQRQMEPYEYKSNPSNTRLVKK